MVEKIKDNYNTRNYFLLIQGEYMMNRICSISSLTFRRFINTKPAKRAPVKISNPLPFSSNKPIILENGCQFIDLKANEKVTFESSELPPEIKNYGGQYMTREKIEEMRQLRSQDPSRWTVTQLAKKFQVSRSFVISKALTGEEQANFKKELDEMIQSMSIKQQKGLILRHKIRADRDASW